MARRNAVVHTQIYATQKVERDMGALHDQVK